MQRLQYWLRFIQYVARRYREDNCNRSAAALTYTSLFAVVPLMTVMYVMLSAVPSFQSVGSQIETFIFDHFVPSSGLEVQVYLQQFSQQARKLTGIGVALIAITAILMLRNIENIFNHIWRTRENRRGLASFLLYWAMLSLGPLFLGLAFGITTYLLSLKVLMEQVHTMGLGQYILPFTPYLLTSAAFTLIFAAVPNCRVPVKNAVIGGLLTALSFEIAKQLFARLVANTSFELIYGTFAAIPLFLLWIYLSWLILLAGAEFVQALGSFQPRSGQQFSDLTQGLAVLERVARRHQSGRVISDHELTHSHWLFEHYTLATDRWPIIRDQLLSADLIRTTQSGDYILGRDLRHFTLWELTQLLGQPTDYLINGKDKVCSWFEQCQQQLNEAEAHNKKILDVPLTQLFSME